MTIRQAFAGAMVTTVLLPGIASAFTIYDDFGSFPDATFGGTGIPNDAVAASMQIIDGSNTLRVAMSATERFSNPPVGDNGAAIYEALAGSNCGVASDPVGCPSGDQGALWNFNFFVDIAGGGVLGDYQIDLYYDFDPAGPSAFGDLSGLGKVDITAFLVANSLENSTLFEGSQNLLFGFLASDIPGIVDAPGGSFDADALGNYQFAMTVTRFGFPVDTVAMEVNVVPIPAAVWLFGSGLVGLFGWSRRKALRS